MKNFIKKIILTSVVLVLVAVLIAFMFVLYFKSVEEDNYISNARTTFDDSYDYFGAKLNRAKTILDSHTQTLDASDPLGDGSEVLIDIAVPKADVCALLADTGFVGMGYLSVPTAGEMADVYFADNSQDKELKITSQIYTGFGQKYIMFAASIGQDESYFFYGKKTIDGAEYDFLLTAALASPLQGFEGYTFDNYAIINKQGVVVKAAAADGNFNSIGATEVDGKYLDIAGKKNLTFCKKLDNAFGDYYLCAILDKEQINLHVAAISIRVYAFIMIFSVIVVAIFTGFLYMFLKDKTRTGYGEYFIEVDLDGNILNVDKNFESKYKKLEGNMKDYLDTGLGVDSVIIKTEMDNGDFSYFNCKKIIKRATKKVLFMASDITDLYKDYIKIQLQHFTDDVTELPNIIQMELDFNEIISGRGKTDIAFIAYELGIQKYSALYGFEFFKKLLKALSKKINEIYTAPSKAYYLSADKIMIMTSKNSHDIVGKIDSAVEFMSAGVRVDDTIACANPKAGFMIYSHKEDELQLSQIISRTEVALSYARNSTKKSNYGYVENIMKGKQSLSNQDVKEVLSTGDINIHFQPQYSFNKKCIVGFEALTRLSGKYSYMNPGHFIENVEQNGAMVLLGDYITERVMQFASTLEDKDIKVSINVSPLQLMGDKFVEKFMANLSKYQLSPGQIGIEITETYEMSSMAKAREMLKELQRGGIHISIDDFGEKYSSLKYIKKLPIDAIKIDRDFVMEIEAEKESRVIVENIIDLGKNLGLYTIVEGVENLEQVKILKQLGADIIQGHIVGKAVSEDVAKEYINSKKNLFNQEASKK